jgi:hypothetical protein
MTELLFDSDHLQVIYYDAPGDELLITFAPYKFAHDGESFWGSSYAKSANRPTLGFVSKSGVDWFAPEYVKASFWAIAGHLARFPRRITYGSSMGGYAALKFSRFLGAQVAVAFAPQYSLNPADDVTNPNFTRFFKPEIHSEMRITAFDLCDNAYTIFDPLEGFDVKNVNYIRALGPAAIPIPVYAGGHNAVYLVAKTERAGRLLGACSALNTDEVQLMMTQYCRASQTRAVPLINALSGRHPEWAARLYEKHKHLFHDKNRTFKKGVWPIGITKPDSNHKLPEYARIKETL